MHSSTSLENDIVLITRWRAGDRAAAGRLLRRHIASTRGYFSRRVACHADVDDLVQRMLLAAVMVLPKLRDDLRFGHYVRATARRLLLQYRRDVARARSRIDGDAQPDSLATTAPPMLVSLHRDDAARRLRHALRQLPEPCARLVLLRYWHDRGAIEIASELRLHPSAVRSRLQRARRTMKRTLTAKASLGSGVWPLVDA